MLQLALSQEGTFVVFHKTPGNCKILPSFSLFLLRSLRSQAVFEMFVAFLRISWYTGYSAWCGVHARLYSHKIGPGIKAAFVLILQNHRVVL